MNTSRNNILKNGIVLCVMMAAFLFASCVKEPICESEHPHYTGVTFDYNLSNLSWCDTMPKIMKIAANRIVYARMTTIQFDLNKKNGFFLNNLPDTMTEAENKNLTLFKLEHGQYKFFTLNTELKTFDFTEVNNYLASGLSANMGGHFVKYKAYDLDSDSADQAIPLKVWDDFNRYKHSDDTYAGFLNNIDEPLVIDSTEITTLPKDGRVDVHFTPKMLSQVVEFYFDIKKQVNDIPFVIDSVYCVFSGIPYRIDIGTGILDFSRTYKLMTKMRQVSPSAVPNAKSALVTDTKTNATVRCYRKLNILGMTENTTMLEDKYMGPGVMQVIAFTRVFTNDSDSVGTPKTINGLVNMHNALYKAELQQYDAFHDTYKKSRDHTVVPIYVDLKITKEMLVGDDEGGIPEWKQDAVDGGDYDVY